MTKRRSLSRLARIRIFDSNNGVCSICGGKIQVGERWQADHRLPLALGGEDTEANMWPVHEQCHKDKTADDVGKVRKADRQRAKHLGIKRKRKPMPGSKASGWKKKFDGTAVRREQ